MHSILTMSNIPFSQSNAPADSAATNQALCAGLSLLFSQLIAGLAGAIARTGGKPVADKFEQQLNHFANQHGWSVLTGLADLTELRRYTPDVDARMLLSVYMSYAQHARVLTGQILGEKMLKSILVTVLNSLPPQLVELNARYGLIYP